MQVDEANLWIIADCSFIRGNHALSTLVHVAPPHRIDDAAVGAQQLPRGGVELLRAVALQLDALPEALL